jgi:outer membrane protein
MAGRDSILLGTAPHVRRIQGIMSAIPIYTFACRPRAHHSRFVALLVLLAGSIASPCGSAEPLWEAGVGLAGLSMPDYRGSDERRHYLLPFPYVIYRGDFIRIDREGITGRLFSSARVTLDLSADAGVPVKSDKNSARQGMTDLDPTFELGPLLKLCLDSPCQGDEQLSLHLPLRAVIATDFTHMESAGWVANPHLNYDNPRLLPDGWKFSVAAGPIFATRAYHAYYYDVPLSQATALRPAYAASGGYSGWRTLLTTSRRFDRFWIGAFARYDSLSGAVFKDSPLRRTSHAFMAGIGVAWVLGQSEQHAPSRW